MHEACAVLCLVGLVIGFCNKDWQLAYYIAVMNRNRGALAKVAAHDFVSSRNSPVAVEVRIHAMAGHAYRQHWIEKARQSSQSAASPFLMFHVPIPSPRLCQTRLRCVLHAVTNHTYLMVMLLAISSACSLHVFFFL